MNPQAAADDRVSPFSAHVLMMFFLLMLATFGVGAGSLFA